MSSAKALAICCFRLGWLALRPKRPSFIAPDSMSKTKLARPPFFAANARISDSGTASSKPSPNAGGALRGEVRVSGSNGP